MTDGPLGARVTRRQATTLAALAAAGRCDPSAGTVRIDASDEREAPCRGTLGVFAQPANVPAVSQRTGRDADRGDFLQ